MECDYLVVGCGIFGSVVAERIARGLGKRVLIIDKRNHIGGNCHSQYDPDTGIEFHTYGTHIFHTSSRAAYQYLSRFDELNGYHHQVLSLCKGRLYQMPINLETINAFFNKNFSPHEARAFIGDQIRAEATLAPKNLEEMAVSLIGRPLYEAFIQGYTAKQWGKDPVELPPEIVMRLPVRFDYREDYFNDARWQGIPLHGYSALFRSILGHENITVRLDCDYRDVAHTVTVREKTIFTGAIDAFYDHCYGALEWRSVRFEKCIENVSDYQGTSVINFADREVERTRVHEPRHLHPERTCIPGKTVVIHEWSQGTSNDPYYPVASPANMAVLKKYQERAVLESAVVFGGRLGSYAYYDMDKAILAALACYDAIAGGQKNQ